MFEVSFWNDHVQRMHYADSFDTMEEAIAYAREGLEYPYNGGYLYTDATIMDTEAESAFFWKKLWRFHGEYVTVS